MQYTRREFHAPPFAGKRFVFTAAIVLIASAGAPFAAAATLCVNPGRANGCYQTIGDAVSAASPGDTIRVSAGTYKEYIVISKPLSLLGSNGRNTIIDASNQPFGISVDGYNNPGLKGVVISGFTVQNAQNAGIAVSNASDITISRNIVTGNDQGLVPGANASCPSLASFPYFTGEAEDCGEGIFFSGVDHSTLANNTVTGNAGGMLITDDTGATHDNLITGNSVVRNTNLDCGITLPSHSDGGVFHNTISGNDSSYNGGPGVGIFAPGPGNKAYGNVVVNNRLRGNGLPGVTMHNHAAPRIGGVPSDAPPPIFNDNVILGNDISANSQDFEDAATAGPTGINIFSLAPMTGTLISQNTIHQQAYDIVINVPAVDNDPVVLIHLNNSPDNQVGLLNMSSATVDATENWWGCSGGPDASGCATISGSNIVVTPWLSRPFRTASNE